MPVLDVEIQKYLSGKATEEQRAWLLDNLCKFYNDLLLWMAEAKFVEDDK